ncbi:MAG TPA: methyltransferase domain-containing protein, partial [Pyrinomonadaceae bacterium]|nr:methyltransferase domain-containing protein [Pyrinomonadaceae bacterium]
DILASLRFSPEGRVNNVSIAGLRFPAMVRSLGRLPVVGYLVQLGIALARLPVLIQTQRQFEGYLINQNQQIADHIESLTAQLTAWLAEENNRRIAERAQLAERLGQIAEKQEQVDRRLEHLVALHQTMKDEFSARLAQEVAKSAAAQQMIRNEVSARLTEGQNQINQHARSLTELVQERINQFSQRLQHVRVQLGAQETRLASWLKETSRREPGADEQQPEDSGSQIRLFSDALYSSFEDAFRGRRTEIKERLRTYLPLLKTAGISADILDLGCGRGEWLELLKEEGMEARGVEINSVTIDSCRRRGLEVIDEDALTYLLSLAPNSLNAVTCFQLIEHLDFEIVIKLVDQILTVLRPGGLIIMETPDPENVLVGSHNFYLDPSHRHPLPSELMQFLLESRGASRVEVMRLNPDESHKLEGEGELIERFNHYFYGPMDYGVVGWKP